MRVLACEPFYGGSHRQFLDGWSERSEHDWHLLTLPARWWKWRLRHSALDFADRARKLEAAGQHFDVVLSTSMVNVAELRGLLPPALAQLPHVQYLHENQLTYPTSNAAAERDLHLAMVQVTSALASDSLWFNSEFHRRDFLEALPCFLRSMPERLSFDPVARLAERSRAEWPGVEEARLREPVDRAGPLRIGWVARWEHDKNPKAFFSALSKLAARRDFRVSVLGERFRRAPKCFEEYRRSHPETIDHWGFVENRDDYLAALGGLDVVVSTAHHEFFGLAVVEAMRAGALPLLPERLSYPELLEGVRPDGVWGLYDGSEAELVSRLGALCDAKRDGALERGVARQAMRRFGWSRRVVALDGALRQVVASGHSPVVGRRS
ncbi:MAG: DUF3524 domain-containing protein [Acidobacteriota bacterium]